MNANEFLFGARPLWWRPRKEWHLGWLPYEVEWLNRGDGPEVPDWALEDRVGGIFSEVTYYDLRVCHAKGHGSEIICVGYSQRGHHYVARCCSFCGEVLQKIKHVLALGPIESLPVCSDKRTYDGCCERCGSYKQIEEHHWAPIHLFPDGWEWPTSLLCRECHVRWHQVVTPNMNRRKAS